MIDKPLCECSIKVTDTETYSRGQMRQKRARLGLPENICGAQATHIIAGKKLCIRHAGQVALMTLEKVGSIKKL